MSLTIIILIMTGLISYQAFNNVDIKRKLAFHPASVKEFGHLYRFISHGFVHADWTHLFINMFVLYQFGQFTEYLFSAIFGTGISKIAFLLFYLSAIIVSSVPSYFKHQDNGYYWAVGASGATSALIFAYILYDPWQWFTFPPLPAIILGIGYLWYSSYMAKRGNDNIGHDAHFWGAVYGIFFIVVSAAAFKPEFLSHFINQLLAGPKPFTGF